jgi:L-lactate dehydrogenase complex protein LldG
VTSRDDVLSRAMRAAAVQRTQRPVPRDYRHAEQDPWRRERLLSTLVDRLHDYGATVTKSTGEGLTRTLDDVLARHAVHSLVVPPGFPRDVLPAGIETLFDDPVLTPVELDRSDGVITTSAVAIAETGTIILDAGPGMGRRALSLVPDLHIVLVRDTDVVRGVPEAVARVNPTRLLTWISGPSATSDIELSRVEGVHGPRRLEVILHAHQPPGEKSST